MYFEEKFNILIENFLEYEQELFRATLNKMYFPTNTIEWTIGVEDIYSINRRFVNLLTTTKLYLDQAAHDLNSTFLGASECFTKLTRIEYDNVLGYRVLEALRNYVQHRGLPVHHMDWNVIQSEKSSKRNMMHSVSIYMNLVKLQEDGKFKKSVLDELVELEEEKGLKIKQRVNIGKFLRTYISSLSNIQNNMREFMADQLSEWDTVFEDIYQELEDKYRETEMAYLADFHPSGFHTNRMFISLNPIKRRRALVAKNSGFNAIDQHIATMES
jgi:hypothetical protein